MGFLFVINVLADIGGIKEIGLVFVMRYFVDVPDFFFQGLDGIINCLGGTTGGINNVPVLGTLNDSSNG